MITLSINEKEISLEKPVTVLEAAKQAGIKIPTLCYHEALKPFSVPYQEITVLFDQMYTLLRPTARLV